jgi:L,D-transpeptidase ErfK/SrfK
LASYPIAVAQKGWDTPRGGFRVLQKVTYPAWIHPITGETFPPGHRKNPLGSRWIGFAKAQKLQFGFHGTNQEELIGQEVSHGCLRMRNEDVEALYSQIEVGAPVEVRP